MPELGLYGSVRGAAGNSRPYREHSAFSGAVTDLPVTPQRLKRRLSRALTIGRA
jgi:hypothetical protein